MSIREYLFNWFGVDQYVGWKEYNEKIEFINSYLFQQGVRKTNIENIRGVGKQ